MSAEKDHRVIVSVIVPTYNRAHIILNALNSVFVQTYRPIELIVVDDGSTDNTAEVIGKWQSETEIDEDFSVRYIHQKNSGAPAARNHGFEVSTGEYIQWWDSDDEMFPAMIESKVNLIKKTSQGVVGCMGEQHIRGNGRVVHCNAGNFMGRRPAIVERDWGVGLGRTQALFFSRDRVKGIGPWNESLTIRQDAEYELRTLIACPFIPLILEPLYRIGLTPDSIFRTQSKNFDGLIDALNKILEIAGREGVSATLRARVFQIVSKQINFVARELLNQRDFNRADELFRHSQKNRSWIKKMLRRMQFEIYRLRAWGLLREK